MATLIPMTTSRDHNLTPLDVVQHSFNSWHSFQFCHNGSLFTSATIAEPCRQFGRVGARHAHVYSAIIDVISGGNSIIWCRWSSFVHQNADFFSFNFIVAPSSKWPVSSGDPYLAIRYAKMTTLLPPKWRLLPPKWRLFPNWRVLGPLS